MKEKTGTEPVLVGVGASAGGLSAITEFLDNLPDEEHCTVFVVQHQSNDSEKEMLSGILAKHTQREVLVAEDGALYDANTVVVAPPGRAINLSEGTIRLSEEATLPGTMIIDNFLRSLAAEADGRSVAVVLSGANTDGTLGSRAVKENNGLIIAQSPDSASFPTMPKSVVDEGLADLVLEPGDMPAHISVFARKAAAAREKNVFTDQTHPEASREKLLGILRNKIGHDFSAYKENTVDRRIQRRMSLHRIDTLADYVTYVRQNTEEARELFRDLLIGVTNFFRDFDAFERLKRVLIDEYLPHHRGEEFRVWVPGCATGEEAYSVAIVIQEAIVATGANPTVSIYATDLDDRAITMARRGVFSKNIEADVSKERL
ncbi:MAG: chemotaxis protein CheB, partial [Spirochaetota bacterium]